MLNNVVSDIYLGWDQAQSVGFVGLSPDKGVSDNLTQDQSNL